MLLSKECGTFDGIEFAPEFEKHNLLEVHCNAKKGDAVEAYRNTSHSLGTILFKAQSVPEMIQITNNIENYYKVVVNSK